MTSFSGHDGTGQCVGRAVLEDSTGMYKVVEKDGTERVGWFSESAASRALRAMGARYFVRKDAIDAQGNGDAAE